MKHELSPIEGYIVLTLVLMSGLAGIPKMFHCPKHQLGLQHVLERGPSMCGYLPSLVWFWAVLCMQLPLFETYNEIWVWEALTIDGWYRVFILVTLAIVPYLILLYPTPRASLARFLTFSLYLEFLEKYQTLIWVMIKIAPWIVFPYASLRLKWLNMRFRKLYRIAFQN